MFESRPFCTHKVTDFGRLWGRKRQLHVSCSPGQKHQISSASISKVSIVHFCIIVSTTKPQIDLLTLWLSSKELVFIFACDFLPYFRIELC
jgi:hypothetical protein